MNKEEGLTKQGFTHTPSTTSITASPTSVGTRSAAATLTAIAPPMLCGEKREQELKILTGRD